MNLLKPVALSELRDVWHWVRAGLEAINERCAETWLPEDVFMSIRSGVSYLYLIDDSGFVVLQKHSDFGEPVLFVWCLWGQDLIPECSADVLADLDELARGMGARLIRHYSPLKAWGRLGYFEPRSTVYERIVKDKS